MILGILPEQGGSLKNWSKAGQDKRFIHYYLESYAKDFDKVYYFSYLNEDRKLSPSCFLVKNTSRLHRWLYAPLMPILKAGYFRKCDVLRVMQITGALPAIISKLLYMKPFVITYGYPYEVFSRGKGERIRPYLFNIRSRIALKFADKVIVTTKALFDYVSKYTASHKISLIPNAVNTAQFRPFAVKAEDDRKNIIYVGRLASLKNVNLLLEAVSLLKDARLTIIGDGPLKTQLQAQAEAMKLDVDFKGIVQHQDLPQYLNAASVFVLPSMAEGHPKALLEAMSCGLGCIGMNVEGTNSVIRDGVNGLLCKPNAQDVADKTKLLLNDEKLAKSLGSKAREFILKNYDFDTIISEEINLLKSLGRKKKREGRFYIFKYVYSARQFFHKSYSKAESFLWSSFTKKGRYITGLVKKRCWAVKNRKAVDFPDIMHIELTNRCNLNCKMCPHEGLKRKSEDMDFGIFKKIVDEFPLNTVDSLGLYYFGESLLYPRLADATKYITNKDPNIYSRLRTNGQLLMEDKTRELLSSGLRCLEFSINGLEQDSYEKIMKNASYQRLLENIYRYTLLKKRMRVKQDSYIAAIFQDETSKDMARFVKRWSKMMPVVVTNLHDGFNVGGQSSKKGNGTKELYQRTEPCPEVFYHAVILSNGEVTFCCADVEGTLSIGNVKSEGMRDIWHGEKAQTIRDLHTKKEFDKLPQCKNCKYGILRGGIVKR